MSSLLEARHISKRFHGTQALRNVDFSVMPGEVHALMGENGAGKSTLAKILTGVVKPDSGEIILRGERVEINQPRRARELGIGIVFQELDLFPHLTVAENMALANSAAGEGWTVHASRLHSWCESFLRQVNLDVSPKTPVWNLSIAQSQLVAIARALSMKAQLLVLDEPTSSLAEDGVHTLFEVISRLKKEGVSFIYVSHKTAEVTRLADRVTVLRDGMLVGTISAHEFSRERLVAMMAGRELELVDRVRRPPSSDVLLDVQGLKTTFLSDLSFELRAGEVLGIAGLVGAGRSELGATLFGLRDIFAGQIMLEGEQFRPTSPAHAIREGLCLLPEDRRQEGLFPQMSVSENATIAALHRLSDRGFVNHDCERERVGRFRGILNVDAPAEAPITSLSGGNQQKVILARWLMTEPTILFLDEPTRGIDIVAKEKIYQIIDDFVTMGRAVILVSSELPELLRCCDRILVLNGGAQVAIVTADQATQEQILALATGMG
jgi:ABC-type sugar transport system ATPase subunit